MSDFLQAQQALGVLQRRFVTILGWGAEGAAHALCLRDSGIDVRIGLLPDDPDWAAAEAEGFRVAECAAACEEADLVMLLGSAPQQIDMFDAALSDSLVAGDILLVADGFGLRYGMLDIPAGVDVGLVVPVGSSDLMRREFAQGRGVPVLAAVSADASGNAWESVLGYAAALGGLRSGIVTTTVEEAVNAAAFGAAAVTLGGVPALLQAAVDTMVTQGVDPQVAYLSCIQSLHSATDIIATQGLNGLAEQAPMWHAYVAAQRGDLSTEQCTELNDLYEIATDDMLGRDFLVEGENVVRRWRQNIAEHASASVGQKVRAMMPWLARYTRREDGRRWR
ncbi:MAG: hypothetical protein ACRDAX_02695 [Propionibacteriaceae bacterium]